MIKVLMKIIRKKCNTGCYGDHGFRDKRFGQQLFRDLKVDENVLKDAISAICGSQQVTYQSMLNHLHIFPLSILGSFVRVPVIYVTIHD
jgi:hypothetical protein